MNKIDYCTSPGWLEGGDSRAKAGLTQGGPSAVITDKCIFRFEEGTHEMILSSLHPGVTVDDIRPFIPWELKVADDLCETPIPTEEECALIKTLDPGQYYTGGGLKQMTFDSYMDLLNQFYEAKLAKE